MLCLQQSRDAICSSPAFNLNLQVDLEANFVSLYAPFTSPPQTSPPTSRATHRRIGARQKMGRTPDCRYAHKTASRQPGVRPPLVVNMQVKESLAMRQRMSRQVDIGQLRAVDMRVDLCGRNVGMSQNLL